MSEKVVAITKPVQIQASDVEIELNSEASLIEQQASSVTITNDEDYSIAGGLTKSVKKMQKKVKDYWEPMRVNAKAAYDEILSHKKEMLDPLESAEKILKRKMADYSMEKERERKAREEAMKRLAEEEMKRKLEEAALAEQEGDELGVEAAMAEAEVMESVSLSASVSPNAPKADGVSQSRTWRITEIDGDVVPVVFGGVEIRPVDEKAVLRLIRDTKGTVKIPGVRYEETVSISVRT